MIKGIIYCAISPSGKKYYGYTINSLLSRKARHLKSSINGTKTLFSCAIKKYGVDNFSWIEIESHSRPTKNLLHDILCEREIYWIRKDNTNNKEKGYNMTNGGDGRLGSIMSEETKKNLITKLTGRTTNRKGKSLLDEMIEKYGEEEGSKRHKDWILKLKKAKKNNIQTKQHRENIGKTQKGRKKSKEEIERRNKTRKENGWYKNNIKKKTIICIDDITKKEYIFSNLKDAAEFLNIGRFTIERLAKHKETYNNFKITIK